METVWIIWVMFCPGQAGLTWFIKYPGLTQTLHALIMVSEPNQSNELCMIMETFLLIILKIFEKD